MRKSSDIIPNLHQLVTLNQGENYWFNGCARYVMESLEEPDFDYWFFSGLTGDNLAQVYAFDQFRGDAVTDYLLSVGDNGGVIEELFLRCGYASSYILERDLSSDREGYRQMLLSHIDKGIPVIRNEFREGCGWGVFVGYEEDGNILLYLTGEDTQPQQIPFEEAIRDAGDDAANIGGWVFVGEKLRQVDGRQLYREVVLDLPRLLTVKTDEYCFGGQAFRAWAADIESGKFDFAEPDHFNPWVIHTVYVCNMATNGSCPVFLQRALEYHPDMAFLEPVIKEYQKMAILWNGSDGQRQYEVESLESLGGGFGITLGVLQDMEKRKAIADIIRKCAACMDKVIDLLERNMTGGSINGGH